MVEVTLFRYLAARLRHRDPAVVRYLNMGLGIERRARLLALFWADHLARTRAAQARWVERANGEWLTVLGAGRLLDFNQPAVLPRFSKLRLVDADPLCAKSWKKVKKVSDTFSGDISCCLNQWIAQVGQGQGTWPETMRAIRGFGNPPRAAYRASGDALLSLNVLSQLSIVWQDGVEATLLRRFGRRLVTAREAEWLDALRPGAQMLVEQHLKAIEEAAPRFVLLVTDVEYLEYRGKQYRRRQFEPPPVAWSNAGWRAEAGVTCEVTPALEGVDLGAEALAKWLPSYQLSWQEFWLWHISPLGTEEGDSGKVHRVAAFALERRAG
jgi:hypothetical protein